jgi:hypothetical protein
MMSVSSTGAETLINQAIGDQQQLPAVAADSSGNIIAVWQSQGQDGDGWGIYARRFDSSGSPVGNEFLVNQTTHTDQKNPAVAADAAGDFVISWVSGNNVYARAFNANGTARTAEPVAIAQQPNGQDTPSVAMDASGNFAVVSDEGSNSNGAIFLQRFTASGTANGSTVVVNTTANTKQLRPSIAMNGAGNFVVAWTDQSSGAGKIEAQRFDASGSPQGAELLVGTLGSNQEDAARASLDSSGNFIVTWQENFGATSGWDIYARRFSAAGTALDANPVLVNTTTTQAQQLPSLAELPGGEYLIAWQSQNQDGNNWGVFAQAFNADGTRNGGEFQVNSTTQGPQQNSAVAWGGSAAFALWDGQGAPVSQGIFGQRFVAATAANQAPIITSPYAQSVAEDTSLNFGSTTSNPISINDPDGANATEQITLTTTHGTLTLPDISGLSFVAGTGTGDTTMTFVGTLAHMNAALNGLTFTPSAHSSGPASLQITANDLGNTGTGGARTVTTGVALTVTPVAHTPTVTDATTTGLLGAQTTSGLVISPSPFDSSFSGYFKITGITGGTLYQHDGATPIGNGSFITFAQGMAGLKFSPPLLFASTGSFSVQASTSNGNAGLGGSVVSATITIGGPPVNNVPGAQTALEATPLVFSPANGNGISISDTGSVRITLSASHGIITLATENGITFTSGSDASGSMTFTGDPSQINAALNGLTFTGNPQYIGAASITLANTSSALLSSSTTTSTISIVVDRVARTPYVTNATTSQNQQTTSGLVIVPNAQDSAFSDFFKITAITGGTLFESDGITPINNGEFITTAQGGAGLRFMPAPNSSAAGSFTVQASTSAFDAGLGGSTVSAAITVNAPPSLPVTAATLIYTEKQGAAAIQPSLAITDPGSTTLVGATFRIVDYVSGEDSLGFTDQFGITGSWDPNTAILTFTGTATLANYQSVLQSVTYTNSSSNPTLQSRTVQLIVNDGTAMSAGLNRLIQIEAVDDAPTISVPGSQAMGEDATLAFSVTHGNAVAVGDVDADGGAEQLTLTVTHGTLTLATTSGLDSVSGDGTSSLSLTGTLASLNAAMEGLQFTPASHYSGSAVIAINLNDLGNTGNGGPLMANANITISVAAVAHTPSVTNSLTLENQQTTTGLVVTPDALDGSLAGYFKITHITGGALFQSDGITSIGDGQYISFAQGEAGLKFTPVSNSTAGGTFTVQTSVSNSDAGLGGAAANAAITVLPVPTNQVPGPQSIDEDTVVVFSSLKGNAITASDPGASSGVVQISLAATSGVLSLGHRGGIVIIAGTGSNDATVTFTGTFAAVNHAMDGLRFTPGLHFFGTAGVTATSTEGSNSDQSNLVIEVRPVVHTPSVTIASSGQNPDTPSALIITPSDLDMSLVGFFKITGIANGALYQNDGVTPIHDGDFVSFAQGQAGLIFTPGATPGAAGRFSVQASTSSADAGLGGAVLRAAVPVVPVVQPEPSQNPVTFPLVVRSFVPSEVTSDRPSVGNGSNASSSSAIVDAEQNQDAQKDQQNKGNGGVVTATPPPSAVTPAIARHSAPAPLQSNPDLFSKVKIAPGGSSATATTNQPRSEPTFARVIHTIQIASARHLVEGFRRVGTIDVAHGLAFLNRGSAMWREMDSLKRRMISDVPLRIWAGSASVVSVGVSVVYFLWIARAGSLLSSLLSSMPAWRLVDPLPILDHLGNSAAMLKRNEDDGLERLIKDASGQ